VAKKKCVIVCDNTSADNLALALAATRPESLFDVQMVIVTGRAAHPDRTAAVDLRNDQYSELIHTLNTKRMAGFLNRAGRTVPVFMGLSVSKTQLRTVIPHDFHVDEHLYDVHNDNRYTKISGDFTQALRLLHQLPNDQTLLIGGPLTEVAFILQHHPAVAAKFSQMVVQAGDFGNSSNLIGGKGNSFNGACDPHALHNVMFNYPGSIAILPSNITKQPEIGFANPSEIAKLGVHSELAGIYAIHYEHTAKRRGTQLFIHDLGLVMLAEQLARENALYPYSFKPIRIIDVPYTRSKQGQDQRGTIVVEHLPTPRQPERYLVDAQDVTDYRDRVKHLLRG